MIKELAQQDVFDHIKVSIHISKTKEGDLFALIIPSLPRKFKHDQANEMAKTPAPIRLAGSAEELDKTLSSSNIVSRIMNYTRQAISAAAFDADLEANDKRAKEDKAAEKTKTKTVAPAKTATKAAAKAAPEKEDGTQKQNVKYAAAAMKNVGKYIDEGLRKKAVEQWNQAKELLKPYKDEQPEEWKELLSLKEKVANMNEQASLDL
jgi:hypothetical protein